MLNFKIFQLTLMKYNFWHYGLRSKELLCKKIGISTKYIDYVDKAFVYQHSIFYFFIVSIINL